MGFLRSLSQAFFIAFYIILQKEEIILELFCVTSQEISSHLQNQGFQGICF